MASSSTNNNSDDGNGVVVGNLVLDWSFDSGNLSRVGPRDSSYPLLYASAAPSRRSPRIPDHDLSLWIKSDCEGTSNLRNYRCVYVAFFSVVFAGLVAELSKGAVVELRSSCALSSLSLGVSILAPVIELER